MKNNFSSQNKNNLIDSIDNFLKSINYIRSSIDRNIELSKVTVVGRTSSFWSDIFKTRGVYPDHNELMVCRRGGMVSGIGDEPQGSFQQEKEYAERIYHIFKETVGSQFVSSMCEPVFGAPLVFETEGISRSANFWITAATTQSIIQAIKDHNIKKPIRVLEIGPGYGACAFQLHKILSIDNYTIVDLPENLYISTIYLDSVLPDKRLEFIDVLGPPITKIGPNNIMACLPGAIDRIETEFDLIINSFSFQEMDKASVDAYIEWIEKIIAPGGILFSINSHAKAGIRKPSDYGYGKFHIHSWRVFRSLPAGFFNTIPYEVVVSLPRKDTPHYPEMCQDAIGRLMQLGLDQDLSGFIESLLEGTLDSQQTLLLSNYNSLFQNDNKCERKKILENIRDIDSSPIGLFIAGLNSLIFGDYIAAERFLKESVSNGLKGFARIRAKILIAGIERYHNRTKNSFCFDGSFDPLFAYPEAAYIVNTGDLDAAIIHIKRHFEYN